jgi:hypothetical protein
MGLSSPRVAQGGDPYQDLSGAILAHPILRHNALRLKTIFPKLHMRSKITSLSLFTVLVLVVTQI